jgi:cellobiose-specific phosphotransferase system component IIA
MTDSRQEADNGGDGRDKAVEARRLAEQGLDEQAMGHIAEADLLLTQAQELDPEAVAIVLEEHDAARAADARDQPTADQDVERVLPRITSGPDRQSRS